MLSVGSKAQTIALGTEEMPRHAHNVFEGALYFVTEPAPSAASLPF